MDIKYINYISDTLYCITDICDFFNLKINEIIKIIKNNKINYFYDSNNHFYIDSKNMCKLFTLVKAKELINHQEFNNFLYCVEHNSFGEDQYDRINKRIFLNV